MTHYIFITHKYEKYVSEIVIVLRLLLRPYDSLFRMNRIEREIMISQ